MVMGNGTIPIDAKQSASGMLLMNSLLDTLYSHVSTGGGGGAAHIAAAVCALATGCSSLASDRHPDAVAASATTTPVQHDLVIGASFEDAEVDDGARVPTPRRKPRVQRRCRAHWRGSLSMTRRRDAWTAPPIDVRGVP